MALAGAIPAMAPCGSEDDDVDGSALSGADFAPSADSETPPPSCSGRASLPSHKSVVFTSSLLGFRLPRVASLTPGSCGP